MRFPRALASASAFVAIADAALAAPEPGKPMLMSLSPWSMFLQADLVVKSVMIALALASFAAFVILLAKKIELSRLSRSLGNALHALGPANRLADARHAEQNRICKAFVGAAADEIAFDARDKAAVNDRIALRFQRIEAAALAEAGQGLGILATIGSTAPFIGLFGTVWGIMNSFVGISQAQTTNLAIVAPGIAEALLATATGLVAAIPAVIFYNHLTRALLAYRMSVSDVAACVHVLAGREISLAGRVD